MLGQQISDFEATIYAESINKYGQSKISCPVCQHTRTKNKRDKPLSVNVDSEKIVYHCHHCEIEGLIKNKNTVIPMTQKTNGKNKPLTIKQERSGKAEEWLNKRGISLETAENAGCLVLDKNNKPVIGFAYPQDDSDKYEAVKWRSANGEKDFWWENSANKLWGLQVCDDSLNTIEDTVVITEGEMDTLAIKESFKGHSNIDVFSVPNGAPNKITDSKKIDPSEDGRFKYIWEERDRFNVKRIILATDADTAGDVLADELSRRLNKAKCYRVDYKGNKDANDLLLKTDAETVRKQILSANPIPLHGLNSIDHYADEFQSLYKEGKPSGISTGIKSVDALFTLQTGNLNIVTGYPGDGKSTFLDFLIQNVAKNYGWKTCFCSFEKPPALHAVQLAQCLIGRPFFEGENPRMSQEEADYAQDWIKDHVLFQDYQDGGLPTIEAILEKASAAVMRYGVRMLVIDPFNFIHNDQKGLDTDMISNLLTSVQLWVKQHDAICFLVAHPTKPQIRDGKKNVVTGVDVASSMNFFNKCDLGLTIYRGDDSVEIHCWKARWGWQAKLGKAELKFDPLTGRYEEAQEVEDDFDWEF
jgi:twinkle protein